MTTPTEQELSELTTERKIMLVTQLVSGMMASGNYDVEDYRKMTMRACMALEEIKTVVIEWDPIMRS
jgi:hypothetical protein